MGHTKRRNQKPAPVRSRTTRSKGKALGDPAENTQLLTKQLRALGLYAANTLGDGNCLFRALSDQLYGTESYHLSLRQDICNWIEAHQQRYEPFVEDERGFDVHLECMRQQATYGGHMELSAFAHMTHRNVKVIQPGLVYVIEWDAGGDPVVEEDPTPSSQSGVSLTEDGVQSNREKRRKRSEKDKLTRPPLPDAADESAPPLTVYVAYHDWEHFSSIRNLRGPHSGPPNVQETPAPDDDIVSPSPSPKKPPSKAKTKETKPASKRVQRKTRPATVEENAPPPPSTPSQIPLPSSRSPSPTPSLQSPMPYPLPAELSNRGYRSPKRTFDESSASSESSQSAAKRAKGTSRPPYVDSLPTLSGTQTPLDEGDDAREKTPSLSLSGPASPASSSELSSIPSPTPSPPPEPRRQPALTQRQRKKLGMPRSAPVARTRASAGKIVIPGGRFKVARPLGNTAQKKSGKDEEEEWQKNGTGRLDVRGFRELKI